MLCTVHARGWVWADCHISYAVDSLISSLLSDSMLSDSLLLLSESRSISSSRAGRGLDSMLSDSLLLLSESRSISSSRAGRGLPVDTAIHHWRRPGISLAFTKSSTHPTNFAGRNPSRPTITSDSDMCEKVLRDSHSTTIRKEPMDVVRAWTIRTSRMTGAGAGGLL